MNQIERRVQIGGTKVTVIANYDNRLRKTVRWTMRNDEVVVRAPRTIRPRDLERMVDEIIERVRKQRKRARKQQDVDLQARAEEINTKYFGGEIRWHTIRWVNNMEHRLGSCTSGGSTDGDIRLSARMKNWPGYVIDYVIAHEMAHRIHANHSKAFWDYLARYPHADRARGFIDGIAFAENSLADDLL